MKFLMYNDFFSSEFLTETKLSHKKIKKYKFFFGPHGDWDDFSGSTFMSILAVQRREVGWDRCWLLLFVVYEDSFWSNLSS